MDHFPTPPVWSENKLIKKKVESDHHPELLKGTEPKKNTLHTLDTQKVTLSLYWGAARANTKSCRNAETAESTHHSTNSSPSPFPCWEWTFPHPLKTSPWPVLLRRFAQAVAQTLVKQPDFGVVYLEMASDFPRNVSWHFGHQKTKKSVPIIMPIGTSKALVTWNFKSSEWTRWKIPIFGTKDWMLNPGFRFMPGFQDNQITLHFVGVHIPKMIHPRKAIDVTISKTN